MINEVREKYLLAGEIVKEVKKEALRLAKPGTSILSLVEDLESMIYANGGKPAFPINISIDEVAAHFTPFEDKRSEIKKENVVKIDIGAHIDGYIADTAITINPDGKYNSLIESTQKALNTAIGNISIGTNIGEIGAIIQNEIINSGYNPVVNLGGHYIDRFVQHAGVSIPNIRFKSNIALKEGDVIALEPFATQGIGRVYESVPGNIYRYIGGSPRLRFERELLSYITRNFNNLPFTLRWIPLKFKARLKFSTDNLVKRGILHSYPVLKEESGGLVAQSEHTIIVEEDPIVTT